MKKIFVFPVLAILLSTSSSLLADDGDHYGIGGHIQFSTWTNNNHDGNKERNTDASMAAFTFRFQNGRFYTGANIQGGEFSFSKNAPTQNDTTPAIEHNDVIIERGELDLIAGYYFWPKVSLFLDIKGIGNTWLNEDYSETQSGIGVGVSAFYPLPGNWILYTSLGYIPLKIRSEGALIGDGNGGSLEFGATRKITDQHSINFGIKSQNQELNYDNGSKQTNDVGGLVIGYNFRFQ